MCIRDRANKVAQMAHDGLARTIRPAHTMLDGDIIFALATGKRRANTSTVGAFAAEVTAQAIVRAVQTARPVAGLPALHSPAGPTPASAGSGPAEQATNQGGGKAGMTKKTAGG